VAVALDVLLSQALKSTGHKCRFECFDDEKRLLAKLLSEELDLADISSLGYASLTEEERGRLIPVFVPQMGQKPTERIVLLARPGTDLESLRGKNLRVNTGVDRGLATKWLERELGVSGAEDYFGEVSNYERAEEALLPTFFGKADACLVREENYRLMTELNPQVAERLQPVLTSPSFIFSLVVARKDLDADAKAGLARLVDELDTDARAKQAFTLLRVERIYRFDPRMLESVIRVMGVGGPGEILEGPALTAAPNDSQKGVGDVDR